jgi:hypothetical protein
LKRSIAEESDLRDAHWYRGLVYAGLGRSREFADELAVAGKLEQEDVERRRTVLKLLDPSEMDAAQPKLEA